MKALENGHHRYELDHHENPDFCESLDFVHKENVDGELVTVQSGTTNEEVLRVLIHRLEALNGKAACRENELALGNLRTALALLEARTADRKQRGVEGTPKP
jgi:hypothetical protein